MDPTAEFLAAPDIRRSRFEAAHANLRVVVENFSDAEHLGGKSMIYLSKDSGATFSLLDWRVSWSLLSQWRKLGREWPPDYLYIDALDDEWLHLSYIEATYDGPVDHKASYCFSTKRWKLW
jgi:hypothetical protein